MLWQAEQFARTCSTPGACFSLNVLSAANAAPQAIINIPANRVLVMARSSDDLDHDSFHHVVMVAGRIVDQVHGLGVAAIIERLDHHQIHAVLGGLEPVAELAERE